MVPQHTVAHSRLTAREALDYAAELRLSGDVSPAERRDEWTGCWRSWG